jgi:hypothetical protein
LLASRSPVSVPAPRPPTLRCRRVQDAEDDNGLELNASIALRKLAIAHKANYAKMQELLQPSELRYFLHGEVPEGGLVPETEVG